jgi:asparagine synthase (glutamine-hydrolysing)
MCGIAGYLYKSKTIAHTGVAINMLTEQRHRGPDDAGLRSFSLRTQYTAEHSPFRVEELSNGAEGLLGFNRLSILDLSANGHQPMCSPDGQVMLAFNGEIYNAFEFKAELEADGFRFKGHSDTEVILYLYLKYGFDQMITRLNGMFAIVLIDLQKQVLFLARDRFGIKPLYIFETNELVAFSSEVKSFMVLDEFKPTLKTELLDEYLLFRNTINQTLFEGVAGLQPGTYRVYNAMYSYQTKRYFDIDTYQRTSAETGVANSTAILTTELKRSVQRQLLSDVKVGCQLSGGIDSSLVTLFAQEQQKEDLETVSVTFNDAAYSEEPYIDTVTKQLSLKSHRFQLDSTYYAQAFEKATWHFESPLNHPNTIGIYLLSQRAKEYVTVLLSGEGADEVFGGYGRFAQLNNPWRANTFLSAFKRSGFSLSHFGNYHQEDYRAIMASAFMNPAMAKSLKVDFDLNTALQQRRELYSTSSGILFDKQIKYELKSYLPDLLLRQDKMSMAHSIENRVPFLDNELVAASFNIPKEHLIGDGSIRQTKLMLKRMAARQWGETFAFRNKGGFSIPVRTFYQDKEFSTYLNDKILPGIKSRKLFNSKAIQQWVKNISTIPSAELDALWIMVAFEAWAQKYNVS